MTPLKIDEHYLLSKLDELAQIGATATGGMMRPAYSEADLQARDWVDAEMRALGLAVRRDAAANGFGTLAGEKDLPTILVGSHTDTVPNGGKFDGALGVLAALAAVKALRDAEVKLRHPLTVVNFAAEEATMSGGTFGSRAMLGLLGESIFPHPAYDGRSVEANLRSAGLDPQAIISLTPPSREGFAAFLELHIEQGDRLVRWGVPIGVVEGIVGIRRYQVIFNGYANHAGTTPMTGRQDALVMAAPFVLAVRETAVSHNIVATVGTLDVEPNASNVIPGRVTLTVEIRGLETAVLDQAQAVLAQKAAKHGGEFQPLSAKRPVTAAAPLQGAIEQACKTLRLPFQRMPSGAGHDAMVVADLAPFGMLFVPSQGGVSHSPDELTYDADCVAGANVLLHALLNADKL